MARLRVAGRRGRCGIASLRLAEKTALNVAADATLGGPDREAIDLSGMQVQALTNAAAQVLRTQDQLRAGIAARGLCAADEVDPEEWFLAHDEDEITHVDSPRRREVRGQAATLCFGCPVKGMCLALSYELGEHGAHGIWGGLGARDRVELLPLWRELQARLTRPAEGEQDGGAVAVAS
jgi:Transcription factor WhiB